MSYDQTFKGKFEYADAHCLEAGLDRFAARAQGSVVELDDLELAGLQIIISTSCSAPASMYDQTTRALRELGAEAESGSVTATFTIDRTDRERIASSRRTSSAGLPPAHHRWELFFAAKTGDANRLRALAERGIALNQTFESYYGWSPLHLAARAGAPEAVSVLLEAAVAPDVASPSGTTALALTSNAEVARLLLAAGADINRPVDDTVAVVRAFVKGHYELAELLLDAGATIPEHNRKDILIALMRAGQLARIQRLLGREPSLVAVLGDPDLMVAAIECGDSVVVDYLLVHGATLPESFLEQAIGSGSVTLAEAALRIPGASERCGASSERGDAMCKAANDSNLAMMQLLARHGVPIHPTQPGPTSPLHMSARSWNRDGRVAAVRWLLDAGVPVDAIDADGSTALLAAATYMNYNVVVLLLERGADPSVLAKLSTSQRARLRRELGPNWAELAAPK